VIINVTDPEPLDLRGEILLYLQNNPNAADSLEGIVNWWLPQIYHSVDAASVEQVLEKLIAEGQVKKSSLVDGTNLYSRQF
jgi:hypothetical protein